MKLLYEVSFAAKSKFFFQKSQQIMLICLSGVQFGL